MVVWGYRGKIDTTIAVPDEVVDRWYWHLRGERERILNIALSYIDSEGKYRQKLAYPSGQRYALFVNDEYPDSLMIETRQAVRVPRGYSEWKEGLQAAFSDEEAPGAFLQSLPAGKEKYGLEGKYTFMGLGENRILKPKAISKAVMTLCGFVWHHQYSDTNDQWTNFENHCCPLALCYRWIVRPALMSILVQGVTLAILCKEVASILPDWFVLRDMVVEATNSKLKTLLDAVVDRRNGFIRCGLRNVSEVVLKLEADDDLYVVAQVLKGEGSG